MSAADKELGGLAAVGGLAVILAAFAAIPLGMVMHAWALRSLWAWFIAPMFHLAPLAYGPAMGVALIVGLFRQHSPDDPKDAQRTATERVARLVGLAVLGPVFSWCAGWIVQRVAS